MSFTERNMAPRPPAGPVIPAGVRSSLLTWFGGLGITPTTLWQRLLQHEGWGTFSDVEEDIAARFGEDVAKDFTAAMSLHFKVEARRNAWAPGVDYNAESALKAVPAPIFLDVLEDAVRLAEFNDYKAIEEINRLFARRGIYFHFTDNGHAEWQGDPGSYGAILQPALDALMDSRLMGARSEFDAAMGHLRMGTTKDEEDAVEEAGKAVESTMKVLLHERGVTLTGKETARPLFDLLSQNGKVVPEADNAVLAAARIRNAYGGHGAGSTPRRMPLGLAALAVRSAASAIIYLADHLP
jgi:hypothetical protein